jgi:E-phenylitaconyl-CoA hydratase
MSVIVDVDGPIARITLDRPEKLNAMDGDTYAALDAAFERIDEDPEIHAAVLTGAGDRAFSAGADLERMHGADSTPKGWGTWKPDSWGFGRVPRTPLVAAIHGYALAGGLELALTCDIRIATPEATFGAPEVKWALLHGLGASRLPAAVGLSNAMHLLLTGEFIGAEEALRIGLVSRIVERDALLDAATTIAAKIASNHPTAVQMTKELALRAALPNAEEVARLYRSYFAILEAAPEQPGAIRKFADRDRSGD